MNDTPTPKVTPQQSKARTNAKRAIHHLLDHRMRDLATRRMPPTKGMADVMQVVDILRWMIAGAVGDPPCPMPRTEVVLVPYVEWKSLRADRARLGQVLRRRALCRNEPWKGLMDHRPDMPATTKEQ